MGNEQPSDLGGSGALEVSGEAAASEPREGTFDHPTPRQELEAFDLRRSLDDLDRPRATMGERIDKLRAAINPVGKDMPQLRKRWRTRSSKGTASWTS